MAPIGADTLGHHYIARRSRIARLELEPLDVRYLAALRWRLAKLVPVALAPAYAPLWRSTEKAVRLVMLEAIYLSGDYHYGFSRREIRQVLARWLHARLEARERPADAARVATDQVGALM